MSKTYLVPGHKINYSNATGSAIASSDVVFIGTLPGVAETDIADGDVGVVEVCGVHLLKKNTGFTVAQGDKLYWNVSSKYVTKTVTDKLLGQAWSAQGSNDTSVEVKLLDTAASTEAASFDVATNVPAIGASTNITAVPGSFADLAAVQTYLSGANMVPNIESRMDTLEAKQNAVIAALIAAGHMAP